MNIKHHFRATESLNKRQQKLYSIHHRLLQTLSAQPSSAIQPAKPILKVG